MSVNIFDGFKYKINNGEATIIGYNNYFNLSVKIPSEIEGYPVTTIGERAFQRSNKTSITIPNSVTTIGDSAFSYCDELSSINVPNSVTAIGSYSFEHCVSLTSIDLPNSITSIGSNAFEGCYALIDFTIPKSIREIRYRTFKMCKNLQSIEIPDTIEYIGEDAFFGCKKLDFQITNGATICRDALCFNTVRNEEPLTPAEFLKEMKKCNNNDPECDHLNADSLMEDLLISLGYGEGIAEFGMIEKWYV